MNMSPGRMLPVAAVAVAAVVVGCTRSEQHATPQAAETSAPSTTPPAPPAPSPTALTLADLATVATLYPQPIDAPGMIGGYESFDVVANLDWAKRVGAAWRPDAVLWTVDAQPCSKEGTVDLATVPDAWVAYRFASFKCAQEFHAGPENPRSTPQIHQSCRLNVELSRRKGAPQVTVKTEGLSPGLRAGELQTPSCTLHQAVDALVKAGKISVRPDYAVSLEAVSLDHRNFDGGGPPKTSSGTWVVSSEWTGLVRNNDERVDAATCAIKK